jgi:uncharacterized membrane protein YgcG
MTALAPDRHRAGPRSYSPSPSRGEPAARPAGVREILRVRIELWIAVVCMALAFGAGLAVSLVAQPGTTPVVATTDTGATIPLAPPLTDQQIQQGLPPGHPELGGGGSSTKSKDGSKSSSKTSSNGTASPGTGGSGGTSQG